MKTNNKTALLLIAASLLISTVPFSRTAAGSDPKVDSAVKASSVSISTKYMGEVDNHVIIRIAVTQLKAQNSTLKIYDATGELLYEETIKSLADSKIIKVSPEELKSLRIVYSNTSQSTSKLLVINTVSENKYDISEIAKL